jgi:hypothetical protein
MRAHGENVPAELDLPDILRQVRALVEQTRAASLWFVNDEFCPTTREQAVRALRWIEQRSNREQYVQARQLRQWLSRTSSAASVEP